MISKAIGIRKSDGVSILELEISMNQSDLDGKVVMAKSGIGPADSSLIVASALYLMRSVCIAILHTTILMRDSCGIVYAINNR